MRSKAPSSYTSLASRGTIPACQSTGNLLPVKVEQPPDFHDALARSDEENPGDDCGFHRSLPAGDLLLLTGFLVFYQRRDSPGRTGPAQDQCPRKEGVDATQTRP